MDKTGIIFDMDGTLWDSAKEVADAWTEAAGSFMTGKIITKSDVQSVMGKIMDEIAADLFPEVEGETRRELLSECYRRENDYLREHGALLYPGIEKTLRELHQDFSLYIVSNCQSGYIEAFLEHYHFEPYFEDIECYGNNGLKKAANIRRVVERNGLTEAYYVGDIQGDYDASMEAGVKFIHAAYGFGTIAQEVPAIAAFGELPEVMKEIR